MESELLRAYFIDAFTLTYIDINEVLLDEELEAIVNSANPISATRTFHQSSKLNNHLLQLTAHQSPMICYRYGNNYRLLAGLFTYVDITRIQSIGYAAYFGAFRSVISGLSDHPFRFKPITDSAIIRSLLA